MTIAILCSGQGGQHGAMFALTGGGVDGQLDGQSDSRLDARLNDLFARAAHGLGAEPRAWVRAADADALHANRAAQIVCALHALAAMVRLDAWLPRRRCVAGYSVGEVVAWSVAGCIDADCALDLVARRAEAMDAASRGDEGMLFVRGLSREVIAGLCAGRDAALAIANPGDAFVLAGTRLALEAVEADARRAGAARVTAVGVRVASHTARLAEAAHAFRGVLETVPDVRRPASGTRLFSGIDGAPVLDPSDGLDKLARQIAEPVEWAACLDACVEAGARAFLELGPGRALAEMASGAYPALPARSLDDFRSWDGVRAWLARLDPA